ncbi:MAG: AraC family transcriptional regulator [Fibrobacterota bacterium]
MKNAPPFHLSDQELVIYLKTAFPFVKTLGYTLTDKARDFNPVFANRKWITILYLEKGNYILYYENGRVLKIKGGDYYYHPPYKMHYDNPDKKLTPYRLYWLGVDLNAAARYKLFTAQGIKYLEKSVPNEPFVAKAPALLSTSFLDIFTEYENKKPGYLLQIENCLRQIIISAFRLKNENHSGGLEDLALIEKVNAMIDDNPDSNQTIEDIFRTLNCPKNRGYAIFRKNTGINPREYVNRRRIELAKKMLLSRKRITAIAFDLGFCSSQSFATVFKKNTGFSPTEFKRKHPR